MIFLVDLGHAIPGTLVGRDDFSLGRKVLAGLQLGPDNLMRIRDGACDELGHDGCRQNGEQ